MNDQDIIVVYWHDADKSTIDVLHVKGMHDLDMTYQILEAAGYEVLYWGFLKPFINIEQLEKDMK